MPPRHGKSFLISEHFTAWYLGRFPDRRVILAAYESTFAASWGRKSRTILEQHGEAVFGHTVSQNSAAADAWDIEGHTGGMITAGAGGPITGKGADLFIIDDPVKNDKEATSKRALEDIFEWYKATVYTRLSPKGAVIIIMTRWASEDLVGMLQDMEANEGGDTWDVLSLPAMAEENDPLGRAKGEALWPQGGYDKERLERIKIVQGPFWWSALYQQNPVPMEGNIVKIEWFRRFKFEDLVNRECTNTVLSWDTAQKEAEISDYTVCGVWKEYDHKWYLVDVIRQRLSHPRLLKLVIEMYDGWHPNINLIENKGSGISLIQHLEHADMPVLAIEPTMDKAIRMQNETPMIEAGRIYLPNTNDQPWLEDFEEEIRSFPKAPRKDQVDMLSQFLKWVRERGLTGLSMW